jgi:hypothetical protein
MRIFTPIVSCTALFSTFIPSVLAGSSTHHLPPPKGPYHVGLTQHVLNHTTYNDPWAPNNISYSVLINIWYPTLQNPASSSLRPYLDAPLAKLYEDYFPLAPGSLSNLTTNIQFQAPTLPPNCSDAEKSSKLPVLIFSPPFAGPPSQCFTSLFSDLTSHGYITVTIDHPYEQPFVQYPYGGPGIYGLPITFDTPFDYDAVNAYRIADTDALLAAWKGLVDRYNAPFNTEEFIFFGHSIGGSASLGSLYEYRDTTTSSPINALGGLDMDGTIFAPAAHLDGSPAADVKKPTLLLQSTFHDADPTWLNFTAAQSGWWKWLKIDGTNHSDFSDTILWKQWFGIQSPNNGTIEAYRMADLTRTFVRGFFEFLQGRGEGVLSGKSPAWPEVEFLSEHDV